MGSIAELANGLDLVVESVPEKLDLKLAVLREIEQRQPVLIAKTSALSVDALSGAIGDRGRFFGMHFFNPVWSLPLVEIIRVCPPPMTPLPRPCVSCATLPALPHRVLI